MTECKFKTPRQLGITKKQFNALVKVSGMLERGELRHFRRAEEPPARLKNGFNMNIWDSHMSWGQNCGTACCIGGWAATVSGVDFIGTVPDALENLFYPNHMGDDWGNLTPKQAGRALCHFLKTGADGEECWNVALGKKA